jgi:hypothetical protein
MNSLRNFIRESLVSEVTFRRTGKLPGRETTFSKSTSTLDALKGIYQGASNLYAARNAYRGIRNRRGTRLDAAKAARDKISRSKGGYGAIGSLAGLVATLAFWAYASGKDPTDEHINAASESFSDFDDKFLIPLLEKNEVYATNEMMFDNKAKLSVTGADYLKAIEEHYEGIASKIEASDEYEDLIDGMKIFAPVYADIKSEIDSEIARRAAAEAGINKEDFQYSLKYYAYNKILIWTIETILMGALDGDCDIVIQRVAQKDEEKYRTNLNAWIAPMVDKLKSDGNYVEAVKYFGED